MRTLVALTVVFALAACGPSPSPPATTPPPTARPDVSAEEMQARIAALPAPYNEASYEAGRRIFAQCRSCHTIREGEPNRVGPNLHGVFGREAAAAGFSYSQALQDANFIWDADRLDHWLANPSTFLPGNRMAFAGVRNETQRRDVIAFLMAETAP